MRKIEYRAENGEGIRDLAEILSFEICELKNRHLVDDIIDAGYADREKLDFNPENPDGSIGERLAAQIREKTGRDVRYGLWLADRDEVVEHYNDGLDEDIDAYEISDICLSDLGSDGRLYAYEKLPEPLDEDELEKIARANTRHRASPK